MSLSLLGIVSGVVLAGGIFRWCGVSSTASSTSSIGSVVALLSLFGGRSRSSAGSRDLQVGVACHLPHRRRHVLVAWHGGFLVIEA